MFNVASLGLLVILGDLGGSPLNAPNATRPPNLKHPRLRTQQGTGPMDF